MRKGPKLNALGDCRERMCHCILFFERAASSRLEESLPTLDDRPEGGQLIPGRHLGRRSGIEIYIFGDDRLMQTTQTAWTSIGIRSALNREAVLTRLCELVYSTLPFTTGNAPRVGCHDSTPNRRH
jgi:hypothetical protein